MKTNNREQYDRQIRQIQRSLDQQDLRPSKHWDKSVIVLATIAETIRVVQKEAFSQSDVETVITEVAVNCGATGDLLATIKRHLPLLYMEIRSADLDAMESVILPPVKPQYEVWTQGRQKIVKDIRAYEKKKDKFLFWADITNGEYISLGKQRSPLSAPARKLLLYLAENIGVSVPRSIVFEHVIGTSPEGLEGWQNRLAHYLTDLQNFAVRDFRKMYLPPPDRLTDSLTLRNSFKDNYFFFITWRSAAQ